MIVEIKDYLREKYPDDVAIQALTKAEIKSVISIFMSNFLVKVSRGFIVPFGYYFSILKTHKRYRRS